MNYLKSSLCWKYQLGHIEHIDRISSQACEIKMDLPNDLRDLVSEFMPISQLLDINTARIMCVGEDCMKKRQQREFQIERIQNIFKLRTKVKSMCTPDGKKNTTVLLYNKHDGVKLRVLLTCVGDVIRFQTAYSLPVEKTERNRRATTNYRESSLSQVYKYIFSGYDVMDSDDYKTFWSTTGGEVIRRGARSSDL
jgi:hypothetical protein